MKSAKTYKDLCSASFLTNWKYKQHAFWRSWQPEHFLSTGQPNLTCRSILHFSALTLRNSFRPAALKSYTCSNHTSILSSSTAQADFQTLPITLLASVSGLSRNLFYGPVLLQQCRWKVQDFKPKKSEARLHGSKRVFLRRHLKTKNLVSNCLPLKSCTGLHKCKALVQLLLGNTKSASLQQYSTHSPYILKLWQLSLFNMPVAIWKLSKLPLPFDFLLLKTFGLITANRAERGQVMLLLHSLTKTIFFFFFPTCGILNALQPQNCILLPAFLFAFYYFR